MLILGAARQGLALARWLSIHGAQVTLSDSRSAENLRLARESLAELPIQWALGGHPLELILTKQLRPGSRIVSHAFSMGDWQAEQVDTFQDANGSTRTLYLWRTDGKVRP